MSDNFNEMNTTTVGHRGEKIVEFSLPMGHECWRYKKGGRCDLVKYRTSTLSTIARGKADADIIIGFRCCDKDGNRCPYLHDGDEAEAVALHEVKTNPSAFDDGISNKKGEKASSHTQNLYIEIVQSEDAYATAIKEKAKTEADGGIWEFRGKKKVYPYVIEGCVLEEDPLVEYGEKGENCKEIVDEDENVHYCFEYIKGDGWWNKRKLAYDRGQVGYVHAEWYHFYQPYDSWEWIGKKRKHPKEYKEATEREIQAFISDDSIPDGSVLLLQYPVELCISISGAHLEKIIDQNIEYATRKDVGVCIPIKSKLYAEDGESLHTRMGEKALVLGYLMPIKKLVPCREVNWLRGMNPLKKYQSIEAVIWGEKTIPDEEHMSIIREKAIDRNGEEIKGIATERDELIKLRDEKLARGENVDAEREQIEKLTKEWKTIEGEIRTTGLSGIRTTIIGKYVIKGEMSTPIKGAIPDGKENIYAIQRTMGKDIKGGMLLYLLKPFIQRQYNIQDEKYIPEIVEQFACHVIPYKPPRKR